MVLTVKTRSGRVSKAPVRLELFEDVEDDYKQDEYDTDEDLLNSDDEDFLSDDDIEIARSHHHHKFLSKHHVLQPSRSDLHVIILIIIMITS